MKRILLLSMMFSFVFALSAWAQRTVSGKVTDDKGEGLPGVNVVIKGTTTGVTTDLDGNYQISVPDDKTILVFSSVGMLTQEVNVGARTSIDLGMVVDTKELQEIVVVGYGVQEKRKLTSAVGSVKGSDIATLATPNFADQLAGRTAGLQVSQGDGVIGSTPRILIRGVNSISSGTFPLVVVDGVPMTTGNQSAVTNTNPLADINPQDIQSYEVLKDGAATAIYGSRAANGVILITTKRGTKGSTKVDFTFTSGFSEEVSRFDLLNADQFETVTNQKLTNAGLAPAAQRDENNPTSGETDWQDMLFRKGAFRSYNINMSGANDQTGYFLSVGYQTQEGAVVANDFERFSFRNNLDHNVNKYLKVGTGISLTRTLTTGLNTGTNALSGNLSGGLKGLPNVTVLDPNNPTGYNLSNDGAALGQGANLRPIDNGYTNQGFVLKNNKFDALTTRVLANIYGEVNIVEGLSFRSQYAVDYLTNKDFLSYDPRHGDGRGAVGLVINQNRDVTLWNWQNYMSFNRDFGDHGVDVVAGVEYQLQTFESFQAQGRNFSDLFFMQNNLITGTYVTPLSSGTYNQTAFDSKFARLNYSFRDRYLLSFSVRNDGLSRLAEANRKGTFYGGSIGYRISEENFFKNSFLSNVVNDLKVRASYAEVGNTDIGLFPYASLYGSARYGSQNGIAFTQAGNVDLLWETSTKMNVGFDAGFLDGKLSVIVDYFVNDIDGNILAVEYPPSLGIPGNSIRENIGIVRNKGLEFTLNATALSTADFSWNVSFNYTSVNNEVIETTRNAAGEFNDINVGAYGILARVGQPISLIYGYKYAGVNPGNGNPLYVKGDGSIVQRNVNTGVFSYFDEANPTDETLTTQNGIAATLDGRDVAIGGDRTVLGNTVPKWYGGLTNNFNYKRFSLEVFIRYMGGFSVYNQTRQDNLLSQDFVNAGTELLKSWTPDNTDTNVPKQWINRSAQVNESGRAISRFVEKGDFLKVQNIVLGYSLPTSLLNKTGGFSISSARVFVQVQNAFTFTKYGGLDPELGGGFDNNTNPLFRTYTFGINVGF